MFIQSKTGENTDHITPIGDVNLEQNSQQQNTDSFLKIFKIRNIH